MVLSTNISGVFVPWKSYFSGLNIEQKNRNSYLCTSNAVISRTILLTLYQKMIYSSNKYGTVFGYIYILIY